MSLHTDYPPSFRTLWFYLLLDNPPSDLAIAQRLLGHLTEIDDVSMVRIASATSLTSSPPM